MDLDSPDINLNKEQASLAVSALLAHVTESRKQEKVLYESHASVFLQATLKKIPPKIPKVRKIPLPHPFLPENSEVCLITKDAGKAIKEKLKEQGVHGIAKVISLKKLRAEFKTFELKRQLADSFDMFLCDDRIYHLALKSLGKSIKKKEPLPIRLSVKDLKAEVSRCLACTSLKIGHGTCSVVRVGHSGMEASELIANLLHASRLTARKIPQGPNNIRSLFVKTSTSVALQFYRDLSEMPTATEEGEQEEEVQPKKAVQQMFTDYIAEHESTDSGVEEEEEAAIEEEDEPPKIKKKKASKSKEEVNPVAVAGKDDAAETGKENKVKTVKRKAKTKAAVSDQKKAKKLLK